MGEIAMAKSVDATVLALLAVLEERARKNGEKSIAKSVAGGVPLSAVIGKADILGGDYARTVIAEGRNKMPAFATALTGVFNQKL